MNVCVAVLLALFSPGTFAAEVHGVKMPDSAAVEGKPLKLNGMAVRTKTFLNIKVYVAGLYLEALSDHPDQIIASDSVRRIQMQMTHNAPKERLADEIRDGVKHNAKDMAPLKERLDRFLSGVPDLKEGQALSITYVPGKGTSITGAGGSEVTVPGKDFADAVFSAWLGKNPLDDDLKKRLLGAK